jgi:1-acyl-sn-glycerol-3-phosphate acyltransferase
MVMLASRAGLPIVPVGVGYSRAWRARSWDRFALPRPFSRIVFVAGESVRVPADADREGLDHYRRLVEERMLQATEVAERLAEGTSLFTRPHFGLTRARRNGTPTGPERLED